MFELISDFFPTFFHIYISSSSSKESPKNTTRRTGWRRPDPGGLWPGRWHLRHFHPGDFRGRCLALVDLVMDNLENLDLEPQRSREKRLWNSQPCLIFWELYGFISFFLGVVLGLGCPNIHPKSKGDPKFHFGVKNMTSHGELYTQLAALLFQKWYIEITLWLFDIAMENHHF
jgi:hypothetical protein